MRTLSTPDDTALFTSSCVLRMKEPVVIASFVDGDVEIVEAHTPDGDTGEGRLDREMARGDETPLEYFPDESARGGAGPAPGAADGLRHHDRMPNTAARSALLDHLRTTLPGRVIDEVSGADGPIEERVPGFRVFRVHPAYPGDWWLYVTSGCWEAAQHDGHGVEFFLAAPRDEWLNLESLTMNAYYHCGPARQRLDVGHTVPIGRPWLDDSACDHYLVSLPYPLGPEFEICEWNGGSHARILWLLPITEAEKDFRRENGLEALEARFEEHEIDPADPKRASVA